MQKKILKLSLVLILTLAVLFSLTACGSKEKDDEKDESENVSSSSENVIEDFEDEMNDYDDSKNKTSNIVIREKNEAREALQRAIVGGLQGDFIDDYISGKNMTFFSYYFSSDNINKGKEALNKALNDEGFEIVGNLTLGKGTPATVKGSIKKSNSTGASEYAFTITENINSKLNVTVELD